MAERDEKGRWIPGASANPGGRPKGSRRLTEDIYRILGEKSTSDELEAMFAALNIPPEVQEEIRNAGDRQEALARRLVYEETVGSWKAFAEVRDRTDPKPSVREISGPGGGPIRTAGVALTGPISKEDAAGAYQDLLHNREPANDDEDT